jgi:hypothetical protein
MFLADQAEPREIEFFRFCAHVPCYDFSAREAVVQQLAMDRDPKAWYELMRRLDRMFDLRLDLTDLEARGDRVIATWRAKIDELARRMPELGIAEALKKIDDEYEETAAEPLDDIWGDTLRDLFDGEEGV